MVFENNMFGNINSLDILKMLEKVGAEQPDDPSSKILPSVDMGSRSMKKHEMEIC